MTLFLIWMLGFPLVAAICDLLEAWAKKMHSMEYKETEGGGIAALYLLVGVILLIGPHLK
jgi:hypothetical protein